MPVKVWLAGDEFDLRYLVTILPSGPTQVVEDGGKFYLTSTELDHLPQGENLRDVAQCLIARINGLAHLNNSGFSQVSYAGSYTKDDGLTAVEATARLEWRVHMSATAVVTGPDGKPKAQPSQNVARYMVLAAHDMDLSEVLEIMGQSESLGFVELYKVYEIVRHVGGLDAAMRSAGISNGEMTRFTRTANHQDASGSAARHARLNAQPPANPMSIGEAVDMIRQLAEAWISAM